MSNSNDTDPPVEREAAHPPEAAGQWEAAARQEAAQRQEAAGQWEAAASRQKQRRDRFPASSLDLEALYRPEHLAGVDYDADIGYPGLYPYTRGVQPTMYRGRFWTMRQYAGFGTAAETNRRFRYLLAQGQTGLSVAFDLPTQMGYDSNDPQASGEVGKVGVAIDSLEDMETLLDQIPLGEVSTSMTINAPAAILLLMYQAVAEKQGVDPARLAGTIQNDVLKEYEARGTFIFPPEPSLKIFADIVEYCRERLPRWNTISISGYHIREAGSTAVQEIAFTLANAVTYVQAALERGLAVDDFAPRLSFFFNAHNHLLEEVAKFRAARKLWAKIMRTRFGAQNPKSLLLRFHTQTAGCTLTAQQPENNAIRVAYQALAAVLGGTQSLHTNSRDEALSLPSEAAALLALRTQQVLAEETGVTDTIDPLGGAYAIEALTAEIADRAEKLMEEIESIGGVLTAIESGYIQKAIHRSAYEYQRAVEEREVTVVGVNKYEMEEPRPEIEFSLDPELERAQAARLEALRSRRDAARAGAGLERLERAARAGENIMEPLYECVRGYVTLGEMCHRLRGVYGAYRDRGFL